jgi:anhydro-N-acetylmuramic acid kinase
MAMLTALGLMSGTSLDGIDAALIRTDGERVDEFGPVLTIPYAEDFRRRLRAVLGKEGGSEAIETELTLLHAEAVRRLLAENQLPVPDVIGFHGHTVLHRPAEGLTRQIGDGALLAGETGVPVVNDFRSADVAAGGEGAPFAPLFHAALAGDLEKPLAVLNVGGVANVTWIGSDGAILAFDTGPGNALIDDWVLATTGRRFDDNGVLAATGTVDGAVLASLLDHRYFLKPPPKSLDRGDFNGAAVEGLSPADGAATLTAFTAAAVVTDFLPEKPRRWLVCGGGRHNRTLMAMLQDAVGAPVEPVEAVGWRGDSLEAQAFAFLAVRSLRGLPLSLPTTTGVREPVSGGVLTRPPL